MNIVDNIIQKIMLDSDTIYFYGNEEHDSTSFLPFFAFMLCLAGIVVFFIGIVNVNTARHQWNLFYDNRDKIDFNEPKYKRQKRTGIIMIIAGIVMFVASFILM